jgi:uncharacterized protein YeeX (DUF496 family)
MRQRTVFKVNRPSFQTKSNIVEKTFDKQKDIEMYFINNCVPNGLQVMNIIKGYISTIVKVEESKKIIEGVKEDYANLVKEYCETTKRPQANLSQDEINQLYAAAWLNAYHKANDLFDRIYRGRGNEIRFGCIVEGGFTSDDREIYFDDLDGVEDESTEIDMAAAAGGTSLTDPPSSKTEG